MKSVDNAETVPLNNPGDNLEPGESFLKRNKLYIIIGVSILLVAIIIVVLCVCLTGNPDDEEDIPKEEPIIIKNNINLEVYSDRDGKEISFLSEEFKVVQTLKSEENQVLLIDGKKYPFSKSMKLEKGKHNVTIILGENINTCQNMFKNCRDIQSIYFNVSNNCTNMDYMFSGCSSLISINTENLETTEVTSMNSIFNGCCSLKTLNLEYFNTSKVVNMENMFCNCNALGNIDLTNFDTSSVTNMKAMFSGCKGLKILDLQILIQVKLEI